jgi:hypothetical protein
MSLSLSPSTRVVEYDEASAYAEENSLLFMETSAKERTKPELSPLWRSAI